MEYLHNLTEYGIKTYTLKKKDRQLQNKILYAISKKYKILLVTTVYDFQIYKEKYKNNLEMVEPLMIGITFADSFFMKEIFGETIQVIKDSNHIFDYNFEWHYNDDNIKDILKHFIEEWNKQI